MNQFSQPQRTRVLWSLALVVSAVLTIASGSTYNEGSMALIIVAVGTYQALVSRRRPNVSWWAWLPVWVVWVGATLWALLYAFGLAFGDSDPDRDYRDFLAAIIFWVVLTIDLAVLAVTDPGHRPIPRDDIHGPRRIRLIWSELLVLAGLVVVAFALLGGPVSWDVWLATGIYPFVGLYQVVVTQTRPESRIRIWVPAVVVVVLASLVYVVFVAVAFDVVTILNIVVLGATQRSSSPTGRNQNARVTTG